MVIVAYLPCIFGIVGLLMYLMASNPKAVRIGEIMFAFGYLVTMFVLANHTLHLG